MVTIGPEKRSSGIGKPAEDAHRQDEFRRPSARPSEAWVRRYDGKNGAEVDAAIVSTYLMLAAENEGLATLWVGSFDPALLRDILPGAKEYELMAMINIGYPAANSKPSAMHDTRKPMDELVTRVD